MSNALFILAQTTAGAASSPAQEAFSRQWIAMLAPGLVALFVWLFIRIIRPEKLTLRDTPGRLNNVNPLHIGVVFLIYMGVQSGVEQFLMARQGVVVDATHPVPGTLLVPAMLCGQIVLGAACLLVGMMTFRLGLARGMGLALDRKLWILTRGVAGFLIMVPLVWAAMLLGRLVVPEAYNHEHVLVTFGREASTGWFLVTAAGAVVLAPIVEELFVRGLLQSMLRRYLGHPWPAILLTSLIFAIGHAPFYQDMPALFLFSIGLGYNYERSGRLIPCMIMHACLNASAMWMVRTSG